MFKKISLLCLLMFPLGAIPAHAADKIKVVTTSSAFASITQEVAGDKAEVNFIASPNRDIHFVTP